MFSEYEYDYDRMVEDCDDLELYSEDDYDDREEPEWENYYHNLTNDIDE